MFLGKKGIFSILDFNLQKKKLSKNSMEVIFILLLNFFILA